MNRVLMQALGYTFLFLGVLGLFLPVLQGFLFLIVGLLILSRHAVWAARLLDWLKRRYPKTGEMIIRAEETVDRWSHNVRVRWKSFWRRLARR
jgi:uncharacterized membrane protein YbaN (DUF454 family)